jgi:formylglycine-generating enzyme required for sulfatase activity
MLRDGRHYNVRLDAEAWKRLTTWIDLNAPFHGSWSSIGEAPRARVEQLNPRRYELAALYANVAVDYEEQDPLPIAKPAPLIPEPLPARPPRPEIAGWPFGPDAARAMQGEDARWRLDLGNKIHLELLRVPAGKYVDADGCPRVIAEPFWMGVFEVTNEQFRCFDADHDSRREDRHSYQFGRLGYGMNGDEMAAVRLSWNQAQAFCRWLSERSGRRVGLPSQQQWEWACRAGSDQDFWFGELGGDFTPFANLGDVRLVEYAANTNTGGYTTTALIENPNRYDDWVPRDRQFDDGVFLTHRFPRDETGVMLATPRFDTERPTDCSGMPQRDRFQANPWGLYDMHGNVAEWTRSETATGRKVARGGSFYDRPKHCTADSRVDYQPYHKVFNVGFRVVVE